MSLLSLLIVGPQSLYALPTPQHTIVGNGVCRWKNPTLWLKAAIILKGLLAYAQLGQAQARPRPQIPTTFDSLYTKRPAKMAFFIAWEYYGGGQVEWVTTSEGKIAGFEVQQSTDAHTWQKIGTMEANPGIKQQYIYTLYDSNIKRYGAPIIYYRVRLVAQKGRATYSPVRSIRVSNPDTPWRTPAIPTASGGLSTPNEN